MASWITYKGLDLPDSPTGDAGMYLKSDLQALADRVGPCNFSATANPTAANDITQGYQVGSLWLNTSAGSWWVCTNNAATAANWLLLAPQPIFSPSGTGHAPGVVPDPGATAGTTRFLREDASWQTPPGLPAPETQTDTGSGCTFTTDTNQFIAIIGGEAATTITLPVSPTIVNATLSLDNTSNDVLNTVTLPDSSTLLVQPGKCTCVPAYFDGSWLVGFRHLFVSDVDGAVSAEFIGSGPYLLLDYGDGQIADTQFAVSGTGGLSYGDGTGNPLIDDHGHVSDNPVNAPTVTDYTGGGATITGTDQCGAVTFNSVANQPYAYKLATITFAEPFATAAFPTVTLTGSYSYTTTPGMLGVDNVSVNGFDIFMFPSTDLSGFAGELYLTYNVRGY